MDEELKRIEEEIRKAKEKRQALEDRKNRRMKQIRAKQERDKAAWLKKLNTVMDCTLSGMKGRVYFYEVTPEQVAEAVKKEGIPEMTSSEETDQAAVSTAGHTEKNDSAKEAAEKKEARR